MPRNGTAIMLISSVTGIFDFPLQLVNIMQTVISEHRELIVKEMIMQEAWSSNLGLRIEDDQANKRASGKRLSCYIKLTNGTGTKILCSGVLIYLSCPR